MHAFGKGLGQAVGQGFEQDGRVIIVRIDETLFLLFSPQTRSHRKQAHVIGSLGLVGHKVAQTTVGSSLWFDGLLAQAMPGHHRLLTGLVGIQHNVVTHALRRVQAHHRVGSEPTVGDDFFQHRLTVGVHLFRLDPHHRVLQDGGERTGQIPGLKKRRPIDEFF